MQSTKNNFTYLLDPTILWRCFLSFREIENKNEKLFECEKPFLTVQRGIWFIRLNKIKQKACVSFIEQILFSAPYPKHKHHCE